jgi:hypothetical protein
MKHAQCVIPRLKYVPNRLQWRQTFVINQPHQHYSRKIERPHLQSQKQGKSTVPKRTQTQDDHRNTWRWKTNTQKTSRKPLKVHKKTIEITSVIKAQTVETSLRTLEIAPEEGKGNQVPKPYWVGRKEVQKVIQWQVRQVQETILRCFVVDIIIKVNEHEKFYPIQGQFRRRTINCKVRQQRWWRGSKKEEDSSKQKQ